MEIEKNKQEGNNVLPYVSTSFINELITKYEDSIQSIKNLQNQPRDGSLTSEMNRIQEARLDLRLYERNAFLEDLKSLLNKC
jgi:hypothetical protein